MGTYYGSYAWRTFSSATASLNSNDADNLHDGRTNRWWGGLTNNEEDIALTTNGTDYRMTKLRFYNGYDFHDWQNTGLADYKLWRNGSNIYTKLNLNQAFSVKHGWNEVNIADRNCDKVTLKLIPGKGGYFDDYGMAISEIEFYGARAYTDNTAPSISASPTSRSWGGGISVTASASDSQSGLQSLQYKWSTSTSTPSSWNSMSNGGTVTQNSAGTWYLHLRAVDKVGNVRTTYYGSYKVDGNSPTISVDLQSRDWSNQDVSVTVSASDGESGLSSLQYVWSTGTSTPSSGWSTITSGSTILQTQEGSWYLHVKAIDNAGNTRNTYYGTYKIDKTDPQISVDSASRTYSKNPVSVTITATDAGGSNLTDLDYAWSQDTTTPVSGWTSINSGDTVSQDKVGSWYLHVRATDGAGNGKSTYYGDYKIVGSDVYKGSVWTALKTVYVRLNGQWVKGIMKVYNNTEWKQQSL